MKSHLTLYVVTQYPFLEPKLEVWPLLEERPACYLVNLRGTSKVLKKGTTGRHYFTDREKCVAHLRRAFQDRQLTSARQALRDLLTQQLDDETLLKFARGSDEAADHLEKLFRGLKERG